MRAIIFIISCFAATTAWAEESDKLDIKKLEQKYWSAKDDDYSVVQNRAFNKAGRFYVYAATGIPINDAYSSGQIYNTSVGYYFSEKWGAELSYSSAYLSNNDSTEAFIKDHQTVPDHNRLKSITAANLLFVPFYAKMSFLDKKIIYFDMGLSGGIGQTAYEIVNDTGNVQNTGTSYSISAFQHFFFSENFAIRFDYRNTWTPEDRQHYRVQGQTRDPKISSGTVNDTALMVGVTFWH